MLRAVFLSCGMALCAPGLAAQQFLLPDDLSPETLEVEPLDPLYDPLGPRVPPETGRVQSLQQVETEPAQAGILRGLDRISGKVADVELALGSSAQLFGRLRVTLHDCRYPAGDPASNAYAYIAIEDELRGDAVFEGWMVAAAPALNALDHARYDVWALRCKSS